VAMRDDSKPHPARNRGCLVVVCDSRAQDTASPAQLKAEATEFNPEIVEVAPGVQAAVDDGGSVVTTGILWAVRSIFTGYLGCYGNATTLFPLGPQQEAERMAMPAGDSTISCGGFDVCEVPPAPTRQRVGAALRGVARLAPSAARSVARKG
jgi:hypothetical protein